MFRSRAQCAALPQAPHSMRGPAHPIRISTMQALGLVWGNRRSPDRRSPRNAHRDSTSRRNSAPVCCWIIGGRRTSSAAVSSSAATCLRAQLGCNLAQYCALRADERWRAIFAFALAGTAFHAALRARHHGRLHFPKFSRSRDLARARTASRHDSRSKKPGAIVWSSKILRNAIIAHSCASKACGCPCISPDRKDVWVLGGLFYYAKLLFEDWL